MSGPQAADFCIFAGWSSSYHMAKTVNENVLLLDLSKDIESQIIDFIADIKTKKSTEHLPHDRPSLDLLAKVSEIV